MCVCVYVRVHVCVCVCVCWGETKLDRVTEDLTPVLESYDSYDSAVGSNTSQGAVSRYRPADKTIVLWKNREAGQS